MEDIFYHKVYVMIYPFCKSSVISALKLVFPARNFANLLKFSSIKNGFTPFWELRFILGVYVEEAR